MHVCICSQRESVALWGQMFCICRTIRARKRLCIWSLATIRMTGCGLACGQRSCFVTSVDVLS